MKYRRDLVIIMIFLSLTFISTQSSILEFTEVSLAGHMMLEHLFFFLLGEFCYVRRNYPKLSCNFISFA